MCYLVRAQKKRVSIHSHRTDGCSLNSGVRYQMKRSQTSRTVLVMGVLFFIVGSIGALGSWAAYWLDAGIERNGQRAQGHITKKSYMFVADGDSDYNVEYWFMLPSGERVESSRGVPKDLWGMLDEGHSVTVLYSAENPKRNFLLRGGFTSIGVTVFVSVISAVIAIFGSLLVLGFIGGRRANA